VRCRDRLIGLERQAFGLDRRDAGARPERAALTDEQRAALIAGIKARVMRKAGLA
jgi:hypothetical protein